MSKVLRPDDQWTISIITHFGAGININKLFNHPRENMKRSASATYCLILQLDGDNRGSITRNLDKAIFSGIAPAKINYKFSRSLTYLADEKERMNYRVFRSGEDNFENIDLASIFESQSRQESINVAYEDLEIKRSNAGSNRKFQVNYGTGRLPLLYGNDMFFSDVEYVKRKDFVNNTTDAIDISEESSITKQKGSLFGLDNSDESDLSDPIKLEEDL
jgi:hypothetical protein